MLFLAPSTRSMILSTISKLCTAQMEKKARTRTAAKDKRRLQQDAEFCSVFYLFPAWKMAAKLLGSPSIFLCQPAPGSLVSYISIKDRFTVKVLGNLLRAPKKSH